MSVKVSSLQSKAFTTAPCTWIMVCQVEILHRDMLSTAAEVCLDAAAGQDGRRAPEVGQDGRRAPEDGLECRSAPEDGRRTPEDGQDGRSAPEDGQDGRHTPEEGQYGRRAPEDSQDGRPLPEDGLEGRSHPRMAATSPRMVTPRSRMVPLCALMPLVRSKATLISSTEH